MPPPAPDPNDPQMGPLQTVDTLVYLHSDHLGSVSVATSGSAPASVVSRQAFDPWGAVRSGGVSQTSRNYTGQKLAGDRARLVDRLAAKLA